MNLSLSNLQPCVLHPHVPFYRDNTCPADNSSAYCSNVWLPWSFLQFVLSLVQTDGWREEEVYQLWNQEPFSTLSLSHHEREKGLTMKGRGSRHKWKEQGWWVCRRLGVEERLLMIWRQTDFLQVSDRWVGGHAKRPASKDQAEGSERWQTTTVR